LISFSFESPTFFLCATPKNVEKFSHAAEIRRMGVWPCVFSAMKRRLDEFDLKLLELIQVNSRVTAEELAAQICLSPSAVQRRLRRLREDKIIEREVGIVAPEAVGQSITAIIEVTLETDRPKVLAEFQRAIRTAPQVMQAYYVTGDTDFVLIVTAQNMQAYEEFAHRFFWNRAYVKHFRTSVVMRRVKAGFAVPVNGVSPI
jgi:Lrp/AsnC family leucine-responsive transcriptional regulator